MKILILCTGNSCRSQMAEAFLKSFDKNLEVFSAGTNPSANVHPKAIDVMFEENIDISEKKTSSVEEFTNKDFDYVITVCNDAKETCPIFIGKVKNNIHIGFEDPADVTGTEEYIYSEFRRIRDEIKQAFYNFYKNELSN